VLQAIKDGVFLATGGFGSEQCRRMNGYVKIVIGLIVVAVPALFLTSCASDVDMPSASDNAVPSTPNSDVPKGPESGEGDFAQH
jgi:hypothetical protein